MESLYFTLIACVRPFLSVSIVVVFRLSIYSVDSDILHLEWPFFFVLNPILEYRYAKNRN